MTLAIPTIHSNGTSQRELLAQLTNAIEAIRTAEAALGKTSPNGRDYYTQDPSAINAATQQHRERMYRLQTIGDELQTIGEAIVKANREAA